MRGAHNLVTSPASTSYPGPACSRRARSQACSAPAVAQERSHANGVGNGVSNGAPAPHSSRVEKQDYPKFVHFFRSAGPYIEGFRGCTFVLVVPGEARPAAGRACKLAAGGVRQGGSPAAQVLIQKHLLQGFLKDACLLHGARGQAMVGRAGATQR